MNRLALVFTTCMLLALFAGSGGAVETGQVSVDDPKDSGNLYEKSAYAPCDLRKVVAQVKRGKLVVDVTLRGKQNFVNAYLHLNTKGKKGSEPEYVVNPDSDDKGVLYKTGGVDDFGNFEDPKDKGRVVAKVLDGGKTVEFKVPLRKLGSPATTGFQARTCGEGSVDIAPGGNHFDDRSYTGRPAFEHKNIKTG
ncbi:MAG: hypothetical protein ACRDJY_07355 [Thermoleophilaceae bacterium]